ncbi:MAG: septal ring lytic transglycosylase RlpA family protein [Candidatus Paceibacterota bacterium]|jgi:rare lipoprotein A
MFKKGILLFFLLYGLMPANVDGHMVKASWYGRAFEGKVMANGKCFRSKDPTTAAHKDLPIGTKLLVRNPENGRKIIVVVKDRGPFEAGRDLDLSRAGAERLGYLKRGIALLEVHVIKVSID